MARSGHPDSAWLRCEAQSPGKSRVRRCVVLALGEAHEAERVHHLLGGRRFATGPRTRGGAGLQLFLKVGVRSGSNA
jgi:hypothetical protein